MSGLPDVNMCMSISMDMCAIDYPIVALHPQHHAASRFGRLPCGSVAQEVYSCLSVCGGCLRGCMGILCSSSVGRDLVAQAGVGEFE